VGVGSGYSVERGLWKWRGGESRICSVENEIDTLSSDRFRVVMFANAFVVEA